MGSFVGKVNKEVLGGTGKIIKKGAAGIIKPIPGTSKFSAGRESLLTDKIDDPIKSRIS